MKKEDTKNSSQVRDIHRLPAIATIAALVGLGWLIYAANTPLFIWINSHHTGWLDIIMAHITSLGDGLILSLLLFFMFPKRGDITIACMEAYITSGLAVNLFKPLFNLPRPPAVFSPELIHVVGFAYKSGGLPSGHTASAVAAGLVIFLLLRSALWRWGALLLGLLAGYSRIYVGVHFPLDVYTGALLGAAAAWVAADRQQKIQKWLAELSPKGRKRLRNASMSPMLAAGFYLLLWYPEVMPGVNWSAAVLGAGAIVFALYHLVKQPDNFGIQGGRL